MFSASEPVMNALRDYMAKEKFHIAKKISAGATEEVFMIMSKQNPAREVARADKIANNFVRRKGRGRPRHPISQKRANEIWHKYVLRFSPRMIKISAEGVILAVKSMSEVEGLL